MKESTVRNEKRISLKALISIVTVPTILLFSGCGVDPKIQELEKNCPIIYKNLIQIGKQPALFKYSDTADPGYLASNAGTETRKSAEREILIKFPYLDNLVVGRNRSQSNWEDVYRGAAAIYLIQQSLTGTTVKFPLTKQQVNDIIKRGKHDKDVEPLARKLFGDYLSETQMGCGLVDKDQRTSVAWNHARDLLWNFGDFLQVIRDCNKSGYNFENYNLPCAKKDYVAPAIDWTPTPVDPWTRQWNDPALEGMAKFAWCWNKGLTYSAKNDTCE